LRQVKLLQIKQLLKREGREEEKIDKTASRGSTSSSTTTTTPNKPHPLKPKHKRKTIQAEVKLHSIVVNLSKMHYYPDPQAPSGRQPAFTTVAALRFEKPTLTMVRGWNRITSTTVLVEECKLMDVVGRGSRNVLRLPGNRNEPALYVEYSVKPSKLFKDHYQSVAMTLATLHLELTERFVREGQMALLQIFGQGDLLATEDCARGKYCAGWQLNDYLNTIQTPWNVDRNNRNNQNNRNNRNNRNTRNDRNDRNDRGKKNQYQRILIDHFRMGGRDHMPITLSVRFLPYQDNDQKNECDASLLRAG
jgi:hypothetical protein